MFENNGSSRWHASIAKLQFEERICTTFIPREVDNKYCVCNRHKSNHTNIDITYEHSKVEWSWQKHTKSKPTSFFQALPQSNSPFLRCAINTDFDRLCLVLLNVWNIYVPGLIIRMLSDTSSLLNVKLEKALLKGILDAAIASDACIITNSYKEDTISQLIGEIIYKSRIKNPEINIRAVGVGKWGNIIDPPKIQPAAFGFIEIIKSVHSSNDNDKPLYHTTLARCKLEPNLTEYIFFDDGTHGSVDTGDFASKLARHLSGGAHRKIPLVTILTGADLQSLEPIYTDLKQMIPVLIIDQSGPLATIMCKYFKLSQTIFKSDENESNVKDNIDAHFLNYSFEKTTLREVSNPFGSMRTEIFEDLRKLYHSMRQKEYNIIGKKLPVGELLDMDEEKLFAQNVYWFVSCLTPSLRDRIHIYDINLSQSLESKIYEAMVQARENLSKLTDKNSLRIDNQMRLALRWSITDNYLINNAMNWKDTKKNQENRRLFFDALNKNLVVFVSNFTKLGIDLAILFTPTADEKKSISDTSWKLYLKELYSKIMRKNNDPLYLLEKVNKHLDFTKEIHLTDILEILIGDFMKPLYNHESSSNKYQITPEMGINRLDSEYICRDLFLWCILTHRLDMAKIFLSQLKTRICSALIASKILKSFIKHASDEDSKAKLKLEADDFEMYAIECVRCSYLYDREQVCELIMRRVNLYGEVTCLQMAIAADDKKFLHEDACKALLTNIWYDKIDPAQERLPLTIDLLTIGFAQVITSTYEKYFKKDQTNKLEIETIKRSTNKRQLKKYGINYGDDYQTDEPIYKQFLHFHNCPIVKFCYTCFGYILFLLFFSYFMLYAFDPSSENSSHIHWTEILTIIFVTTMLLEDIRQFFFQDATSWKSKISTYLDLKNRSSNLCIVLPAYFLFYIGLILRFVLKDAETFGAARIVLAYDLELWFIRSTLFITIFPRLGPKLVMIRKMTNDLLFFAVIIVVVILGYGVTSRAMTAYGTIDFDGREFFRKIVSPVYYFILGSFDDELSNLNDTPDDGTKIATQILFAFHMLFVNILLLNLLIALFSFTINNVQEQANYIWAYDRCGLVRDYYGRPELFPPFTFLISLFEICRWCYRKLRCRNKTHTRYFKMIPIHSSTDDAWSEFERYSTNDYVRRLFDAQTDDVSNEKATDTSSELSTTTNDETKHLKSGIDQLNNTLTRIQTETNDKSASMEIDISHLRDRVNHVDNRLDKVIDSLDWIMGAMARVKMGRTDPPSIKEQQESTNNVADNRRVRKRNSASVSQQSKPEISTTSFISSSYIIEKKDIIFDSFTLMFIYCGLAFGLKGIVKYNRSGFGKIAASECAEQTNNHNVELHICDLSKPQDVHTFAQEFI
ncbi:hypothetical protein I4U23_005417 [Adineta vaga]|nr:hypothetical protein I4U23_005417 [Adineta vaga]